MSAHQTIEAEYESTAASTASPPNSRPSPPTPSTTASSTSCGGPGSRLSSTTRSSSRRAFGPLTASLRRAEAYHHDLEKLVPRVVGQHGLDDADDIAAVLRYRVDQAAASPPRGCRLRPRLIAGLIPEPLGEMSAEDRQAIDERAELIEARARALADGSRRRRCSPGLGDWGRAPTEPRATRILARRGDDRRGVPRPLQGRL